MWVVLCHTSDLPALWAFQGLTARGLSPLELVSAEALASSLQWVHRVGTKATSLTVRLADGREFSDETLQGVLNRLVTAPTHLWQTANEADREYVVQELTAFYLSWLYGLPCPVINRPSPVGLGGQWRDESEWVYLAGQAGLTTRPYRRNAASFVEKDNDFLQKAIPATRPKTVFTLAQNMVGATAPPDVIAGCLRLASLAETELLGIDFIESPESEWTFAGANPQPDLSLGGPALLDALARALTNPK
jgi:hypothetical protein